MAAVSMEDITREAEARVRKYGAFGVSERQIAQALTQDEMAGNINAVDSGSRQQDEDFYEGMPMHGDQTDPLNGKGDRAKTEAILARLRLNAAQANAAKADGRAPSDPSCTPAVIAGITPTTLTVGIVDRCRNAAVGIIYDLTHWDSVPGNSTLDKCRRVAQGRFEYLMGFLVLILLVGTLIKCFAK
jgi:hypothetical protein